MECFDYKHTLFLHAKKIEMQKYANKTESSNSEINFDLDFDIKTCKSKFFCIFAKSNQVWKIFPTA
jgi:hypothetical protein